MLVPRRLVEIRAAKDLVWEWELRGAGDRQEEKERQ